MSGGRKFARDKAKLFVALLFALAWVGLGPHLLLRLAVSASALIYTYFSLWATGVSADFYTTYRFYRENPANFEKEELSGYMRRLYRLFGFKAGVIAFLSFVEVPVGLIISFALIPVSARVFGLQPPETLVCLSSSFAFLGIGHLAAALWNYRREVEERSSMPTPLKS